MADSVFKYPGGKTQLFSWIINKVPQHRTWVDVFGGSGVVTANKQRSEVEVYNDLDRDLVHFFTTLRDKREELVEWLEKTPHCRALWRDYATDFYNGLRPDDDVERAGRFYYLRYTQWGAKYNGISGYNGGKETNATKSFRSGIDRLNKWQERFKRVQIECLDCVELIERYDSAHSFLYCDPPYMDEGDALYSHDGYFDHELFVDSLLNAESNWMVSYTRVPDRLQEAAECIAEQDRVVRIKQGQGDWEKENTERLVMNYDPREAELFSPQYQSGLNSYMD